MPFTSLELAMMGTNILLQIDHPNAENILEQAEVMLKDFETRFNANNNQSDLMQINHNAGIHPVHVDDDLFELIEIGKRYSIASSLNLNIAIGPLVKLWHIGFDDARKPNIEEIKHTLQYIHPEDIILDHQNKTVFLTKKMMEIDLGSLAKGYFADKIKKYFLEAGVQKGLINLGGNVLTIGESITNNNGFWRIGIQKLNRERGNILGFVEIIDQSVVTSGIYERNHIENGRLYHHILDSHTGYPINSNIGSLTIIADDSLTCELWTTILFHHTPKEAITIINDLAGIEGIILDLEENIYLSEGIKNNFVTI